MSDIEQQPVNLQSLVLRHPTLLAGGLTFATIAYGILFNFGYFYSIGIEFMTFMTFNDFLEATLPFALFSAAFLVLGALTEAFELDEKGIVEGFRNDWKQLKEDDGVNTLVFLVLGVPLLIGFHIFRAIGSFIFYILLVFQLVIFSGRTEGGLAASIFKDDIVFLTLVVSVAVLLDRFFRRRPKKYKSRIRFARALILSSVVVFVAGQLSKGAKWTVSTSDGRVLTDIVFLRSMDKGVVLVSREGDRVKLLRHSQVKNVDKTID